MGSKQVMKDVIMDVIEALSKESHEGRAGATMAIGV